MPRKSYVVPDDVKVVFYEKYPDMKHISAMMGHCVAGNSLLPFIILTNLQNLTNELDELSQTEQNFISCSTHII